MFFHKEAEYVECAQGHFFVYILECSDHSYYVGCTEDISQRLLRHKKGDASCWTAVRNPFLLVYFEIYDSFVCARRREVQLKGRTRRKKEKLILGEWKKQ